jgi:hypothetical protein
MGLVQVSEPSAHKTFSFGHVATLIVRIGRVATHRAGSELRERRLRLLMHLYELTRRLAALGPVGQYFQQVHARRRADAHVVHTWRYVKAQEIPDVGRPHLGDDGLVVVDARVGALRIVGHIFVHDEFTAVRREGS